MAWMFSPLGIGIIVVLIVVIASLMYWKRKPIKRWLRRQEVDEVELGIGPVKVKLKDKKKAEQTSPSAGVDFGEGSDFTGATIRTVAGRESLTGYSTVQPACWSTNDENIISYNRHFSACDYVICGAGLRQHQK